MAVSILAAAAPGRARAQPASGPLVTLEASGGMALSAPQADRFGPGGAAAVSGYYAVAPFLLAGAKLRAGLLSNGDAPADPGQLDPGTGTFQTLAGVLRVRPFARADTPGRALGLFIEAGPAAVLTGELVRAGAEAGIGFGFELFGASLAPALRYLQVVQPGDPLSGEDARVLMLGAELALLDARPGRPTPRRPAPPPPRRDRDGDGLFDDRDACPDEAEDPDGHHDDDGCPESDNDGDKLKDEDDRCPNDSEDFDAYEDEDGCPEPDNDGDGFLDADDQCPAEAETINGNQDYDGCPDEGLIEMRNDRIVLEERVLFDFERARVRSAARDVLSAIVRLYEQHPEWMKIRIEGHADVRGDEAFNRELSERRAVNVRKQLVKLGIPADMIEAEGYGSQRPRDTRDEPDAHKRNRRVEFVVVARSTTPVSASPASVPADPALGGPGAPPAADRGPESQTSAPSDAPAREASP